jgi:hypothetical protein
MKFRKKPVVVEAVQISDRDLSIFALGVEVGIERAVEWVRAKAAERWSQREKYPDHWAAYPSWEHTARQTDWLADDLERSLSARRVSPERGQEGAA